MEDISTLPFSQEQGMIYSQKYWIFRNLRRVMLLKSADMVTAYLNNLVKYNYAIHKLHNSITAIAKAVIY